jgi:hypothetical protein
MNEQFGTSPEHISEPQIADVTSSDAVRGSCQTFSRVTVPSLRMPAALLSSLGNKASAAKTRHHP